VGVSESSTYAVGSARNRPAYPARQPNGNSSRAGLCTRQRSAHTSRSGCARRGNAGRAYNSGRTLVYFANANASTLASAARRPGDACRLDRIQAGAVFPATVRAIGAAGGSSGGLRTRTATSDRAGHRVGAGSHAANATGPTGPFPTAGRPARCRPGQAYGCHVGSRLGSDAVRSDLNGSHNVFRRNRSIRAGANARAGSITCSHERPYEGRTG
jgi:hypothetical protein